jgi:hypothetical protein
MIAGAAIQIARRDQTTLIELPLVPSTALDPCAGGELLRLRADRAPDIFDALDSREADIEDEQPLHAAALEMRVRVEQACVTARPASSMRSVEGPMRTRMSSSVPTATIFPPAIATACAMRSSPSTVMILPLTRTRSAALAG